jgi:hypothetical protein
LYFRLLIGIIIPQVNPDYPEFVHCYALIGGPLDGREVILPVGMLPPIKLRCVSGEVVEIDESGLYALVTNLIEPGDPIPAYTWRPANKIPVSIPDLLK